MKLIAKYKIFLPILISFIAVIVDTALKNNKDLDGVTWHIGFRILIGVLVSAPLIVLAIKKKGESIQTIDRLTLIFASLFEFAPLLANTKKGSIGGVCAYCIIASFFLIIPLITRRMSEGNILYIHSVIIVTFVSVALFSQGIKISYINGFSRIIFLIISALISLAIIAIYAYLEKSISQGSEEHIYNGKKIMRTCAKIFIVGTIISFVMLNNLNYVLDSEPDVTGAFEITHKDKTDDNYYIYVEIEGSRKTFSVSSDSYNNCEIGDKVTISQYSGFFNVPFYLFE